MEELNAVLMIWKTYFEANMEYWYILNFILGMCFASCIGLIVARWPAKMNYEQKIAFIEYWQENNFDENNEEYKKAILETEKKPDGFWFPGSRCDHCGKSLKLWHNIPLIGWLSLGGKCGFCKVKIPFTVLLAEILGGLAGLLIAWLVGEVSIYTFMWLAIAAYFAACSWVDWNTLFLPTDSLTKFIWLGLIVSFFAPSESLLLPVYQALAGVIVGYSVLLILNWIGYAYMYTTDFIGKITRGKGRDFIAQAFGDGDLYLLAALGVFMGYEKILITAFIAMPVGLILSVICMIYNTINQKENEEFDGSELSDSKIVKINGKVAMPFGPSICLAALITIVLYKINFIQPYLDML